MTEAHEKKLRKSLEKIARENDYENSEITVTPITSDGANYTSKLFLATITAPDKPKLNLFAKIAAVGEAFRSQLMTAIFDVEYYAYNTLSKIFDRIQDKYHVPAEDRLVMPKFYLYDSTYLEETLILEDLTAQGFTTHDRFETFGWEYASRCLEEVAKLHALSIVFQEEYPDEFQEAIKVCKTRSYDGDDEIIGVMEQMVQRGLAAITEEELREKLKAFLDSQDKYFMMQFTVPGKRPVLAHGDFRMSNIMHKAKSEGRMDVTIIDWQCVQVGAGIRDVLYFLLAGTDEEFRGKHFHQLLDHYYDQLCVSLRRFNHDPKVLYPRADYDYEVKKNMPFGMMVAMFLLPVITVAAEDAPIVDGEFAMESMVAVQSNPLFEIRLTGLIRDCAKWGVI